MAGPLQPGGTDKPQSTIAILGAGALGRLWAAHQPEQSCFFLRPPTRSGRVMPDWVTFQFQTAKGDVSDRRIRTGESGAEPISALLVTTKAGQTLAALEEQLDPIAPTVPIVLFQNGMGSQDEVAERWPDRPIFAATTTEGANRPAPDKLVHAGSGETRIGPLTDAAPRLLRSLIKRLEVAGFNLIAEANIRQRLWEKLIINAGINPFTAILDCTNGQILDEPFYQKHIAALCEELSTALQNSAGLTVAAREIRDRIEAVARATAANTSSMRADMLNGRTTEIDFINGFIVRQAEQHGLSVPVNRMLVNQVHLRSSSQEFPANRP